MKLWNQEYWFTKLYKNLDNLEHGVSFPHVKNSFGEAVAMTKNIQKSLYHLYGEIYQTQNIFEREDLYWLKANIYEKRKRLDEMPYIVLKLDICYFSV